MLILQQMTLQEITGIILHRVVLLHRYFKLLVTYFIRLLLVLTELHFQLDQLVLLLNKEMQVVKF